MTDLVNILVGFHFYLIAIFIDISSFVGQSNIRLINSEFLAWSILPSIWGYARQSTE